MRPVPAVSPRQGAVGGGLSLALHAGGLALALWGMGQAALPPAETVVEIALVSAADGAAQSESGGQSPSAPAATAAPVPSVPAAVPAPVVVPRSPVKLTRPVRPDAVSRPVPAPVPAPSAAPVSAAPTAEATSATGESGSGGPGPSGPGEGKASASEGGAPAGDPNAHGSGGRSDDRQAEPLDAPPPSYPLSARRRGLEGRVQLRIAIDANGRVETVDVAASSGSETLDDAAVEAVRRWRFRPERRGGETRAATIVVPIRFQLGGVVVARSE
ncbi:energy transducer TonB [Magnetospirillum fulvum]|uniref:Protein TonB n=1 Tax=Magnetospirillum fulvum MGU-K5 TaxID=1316936 RepID=S9TTH5_MAGFU|nr:energy transducer TonB [Magnetospirillum fulvum]EPY01825.1 Gram-negative bacterial tonB protein [Magnetospirillum fulvum MGU-K5]